MMFIQLVEFSSIWMHAEASESNDKESDFSLESFPWSFSAEKLAEERRINQHCYYCEVNSQFVNMQEREE